MVRHNDSVGNLTVRETAQKLLDWGLHPVPLVFGKGSWHPPTKGMGEHRPSIGKFSNKHGLGIYCNPIDSTTQIVGVDLDSEEAIANRPKFFPDTELMEGRPGREKSHFYVLIRSSTVPDFSLAVANNSSPVGKVAGAMKRNRGWTGVHTIKWGWGAKRQKGEVMSLRGTGSLMYLPPTYSDKGGVCRKWDSFHKPNKDWNFQELLGRLDELSTSVGGVKSGVDSKSSKYRRNLIPKAASITSVFESGFEVVWEGAEDQTDSQGQRRTRIEWGSRILWVNEGVLLTTLPYVQGTRNDCLRTKLLPALVSSFFPTAKCKAPTGILLPLVKQWHQWGRDLGTIGTPCADVSVLEFTALWERTTTPFDQYQAIVAMDAAVDVGGTDCEIVLAMCHNLAALNDEGVFFVPCRLAAERMRRCRAISKDTVASIIRDLVKSKMIQRCGAQQRPTYCSPRYVLI